MQIYCKMLHILICKPSISLNSTITYNIILSNGFYHDKNFYSVKIMWKDCKFFHHVFWFIKSGTLEINYSCVRNQQHHVLFQKIYQHETTKTMGGCIYWSWKMFGCFYTINNLQKLFHGGGSRNRTMKVCWLVFAFNFYLIIYAASSNEEKLRSTYMSCGD